MSHEGSAGLRSTRPGKRSAGHSTMEARQARAPTGRPRVDIACSRSHETAPDTILTRVKPPTAGPCVHLASSCGLSRGVRVGVNTEEKWKEPPLRRVLKRLLIVGCLGAGYHWLVRPWLSRSVDRDEAADVTDEALIDASPDVVYRAVVDEHDGKTNWWTPYHSMELREGDSYGEVGALLDNTVRVRGRFPIRFTTRTVEVEQNERIRVEYVGGAFRGEALWKFEGVNGKTRLRLRWRTSPSGVLRALAPFLPVEKSHSDTMKVGFENLSAFLDRTRSGPGEVALSRS